MGVIMNPAGAKINKMSGNDEYNGKWQQPQLICVPYLFGKQQQNTQTKNNQGNKTMMMLAIPVPKRVASNEKSQEYH